MITYYLCPKVPKFLILQPAFIGDVVLATALVEKIHLAYPESRVDILVRKGNELLLQKHPLIRKVWVWDKTNHKSRNLFKLILSIRAENFSHVINPHRFFSSGLISMLSGAKHRTGFDKNPLSLFYTLRLPHIISTPGTERPVHEVERNQQLIAAFTNDDIAMPALYPTKEDEQSVKQFKNYPYITIAPSSVWFTKQYPKDKWVELIKNLPTSFRIYLLGGKGDKMLADEILTLAGREGIINLSGRLSFLASAALMRDAAMNYVNDSGPLHFCTAMNAPVTAVFCSTVPAFGFGPLQQNGRVVEHTSHLYCRPCGLHGHNVCPQGHFRCAKEINLEDLLNGLPT